MCATFNTENNLESEQNKKPTLQVELGLSVTYLNQLNIIISPSDEQSVFDLKDLLSPNEIRTFTVHMTQIGLSNF